MKWCFLDLSGPGHSWTHSSMRETCTDSSQIKPSLDGEAFEVPPELVATGGGESVFLGNVAPERVRMLQQRIPLCHAHLVLLRQSHRTWSYTGSQSAPRILLSTRLSAGVTRLQRPRPPLT